MPTEKKKIATKLNLNDTGTNSGYAEKNACLINLIAFQILSVSVFTHAKSQFTS